MPTTTGPSSPAAATVGGPTRTGARRHDGPGLVGRLNAEWAALCADPPARATVSAWAEQDDALAGCTGPADVEDTVRRADHTEADRILLALLQLAHDGDDLAARTVLQLMLGKAVRIARSHAGRDAHENLEHAAVAALWTTIATYPIRRRPKKVAANLAMDTVRAVCGELAHDRSEAPAEPDALARLVVTPGSSGATPAGPDGGPADLELIELVAWAVDHGVITAGDATLIVDVYAPVPGEDGGAAAAARHGLTWPAARQRSSRAVRRITRAIHEDASAR